MRNRLPKPTYLSFLFSFLLWLLEQEMSTEIWWNQIPFWTIFFAALAFGLGAFVQDLYNVDSWIWENWRQLRKLAKLVALPVDEAKMPCTHISVTAALKFTKEIKDGRIYIDVKYLNSSNIGSFIIYDENHINEPANAERRIPICHVRAARPGEPPHHSLWGSNIGGTDLEPNDKTIMPDGQALVTIHLKSGFRQQKIPFIIHFRKEDDIRQRLVYTRTLNESEGEKLWRTVNI